MFAQQISYYRLIKQIGAGGMGEVYLAEDTRLNRKVALKLLPENFSKDRRQLSRFLREASLAANLNHPNICIIYEVSDSAERPFIAMEYVEGETLFEKIQSHTLTFGEIVEIAVQIADALDEAHRQGIIHRDIKAANIIINHRGMVKILDFGLAKTVVEDVSDEAVTRAKTEAGILVGTVRYMSPEQSLGKNLDGRTDLWSLGVLLYEMVSGETPFKGDTQVAIFDEILHKNPPLPSEFSENIPAEFEKIIFKLLEKDYEFRYQTASDLRADLRRLQRTTGEHHAPIHNSRATLERSLPPPPTGFAKLRTEELANQSTGSLSLNDGKKAVRRNWIIGGLAAVLLIAVSIGAYKFGFVKSSTVPFEKRESLRLTTLGTVLDAVISADGKYLVYVQDEGELQSLWVKQIATGSSVQVVPSANIVYQGISVSKDGNWIYYNIWDRKSVGQIFRVPILGGIPQKIIHDAMPGVEISSDSRYLAFIRSYDAEQRQDLILADIENIDKRTGKSEERVLTSSNWNGGIYAFTWSPDNRSLAIISNRQNAEGKQTNLLIEIFIEDKSEKVIWEIPSKVKDINSGLVWKTDKSGILTTIAETQDPYSQIWQISYPDGEALRLTKDINSYGRLSVTSDGKNLVSIQQEVSGGLWVMPFDKPEQAEKITDGKLEGLNFSWTPDGRIIYTSAIGGNIDIWIADASGANKKQITSDAFVEGSPCVTADGKTIAYGSNRENGNWNLWLMNLDGTNQRKLLQSGLQWNIYCSKLTNSFFYNGVAANSVSKKDQDGLWKVSIDGGEPQFIWNKSPFQAEISPDEKYLAYNIWNPEKKQLEQNIYSLETGKSQTIELPPTAVGEDRKEPSPKWTADGRSISFLNEEKLVTNIWTKSLRDGKLKKISNFNENRIYGYSWSPDGKKLLILRGLVSRDVVMIKENN